MYARPLGPRSLGAPFPGGKQQILEKGRCPPRSRPPLMPRLCEGADVCLDFLCRPAHLQRLTLAQRADRGDTRWLTWPPAITGLAASRTRAYARAARWDASTVS